MMKNKIRLIDSNWVVVGEYKSSFKPTHDELVYLKKEDSYFKVINVIHSLLSGYELILVVEKVEPLKF